MAKFRVTLIYIADGMKRALTSRQVVQAERVRDAVERVADNLRSAYESGFEVLSWVTENLDAREGRYVAGGPTGSLLKRVVESDNQLKKAAES